MPDSPPDDLIALTIGEPYPLLYPQQDGVATILEGSSVNFRMCLANLCQEEIKAFTEGQLITGVYVEESIPFFVFQIDAVIEFASFLNILLENQATRDAFLAGEPKANMIRLDLIDHQTGVLHGVRLIGVPVEFMTIVKAALFNQLTKYKEAQSLTSKGLAIEARTSIEKMMKRGSRYIFPAG